MTYRSRGLSLILAFIGLKMLLIDVWHVPIWASLAVIALVLAATAVLEHVATDIALTMYAPSNGLLDRRGPGVEDSRG
jgi:hypothetical protein